MRWGERKEKDLEWVNSESSSGCSEVNAVCLL